MRFINGPWKSKDDDLLEQLFDDVITNTEYFPRLDALPFYFVRDSSEDKQVRSLKYHAEKKALACSGRSKAVRQQ